MSIILVVSQFNTMVTHAMRDGALVYLKQEKVNDVVCCDVSGCFEIPLAAEHFMSQKSVQAVVALGAVIKGDTSHDIYLAQSVVCALQDIQIRHRKPIGMGILTCDTLLQALDRAGGKSGNKGFEAASAALSMVRLLTQ